VVGVLVAVKQMLTMQLGPQSVLAAARVQFEDALPAQRLAIVCDEIAQEMRRRMPDLQQVFLTPDLVEEGDRERGEAALARTTDEVLALEGRSGLQRARTATARRLNAR
jgi:divalent metal cation (Fe/Co/Zn/Cd) transporter